MMRAFLSFMPRNSTGLIFSTSPMGSGQGTKISYCLFSMNEMPSGLTALTATAISALMAATMAPSRMTVKKGLLFNVFIPSHSCGKDQFLQDDPRRTDSSCLRRSWIFSVTSAAPPDSRPNSSGTWFSGACPLGL